METLRRPERAAVLPMLVLTAVLPSCAPQSDRLGGDVVPTFEAVRLRLDPGQPDYSGSVRIDLRARKETDAFRFHAKGQALGRVALFQADREVPVRHQQEESGLVTVTAGRPLSPGAYRLEVDFTNPFDTRVASLYRVQKDGASYVFSQLEPDEARRAFPCWDEPAFKIPYQLTVETPAANEVITNSPAERQRPLDGGWKSVEHKKTPPLPSYLVALAVGPFEMTPVPGLSVPGRIVTVRGQSRLTGFAVAAAPPLLAAMERYFGRRYPYEKLDLIAVPDFWPGAMENPGAITFADGVLLADPAAVSVSQRRLFATVMAHELAHMWFGDLVTLEWWNDLWLNESFADWMADKIADQVSPELGVPLTELQRIQNAMAEDARPSTGPVRRTIETAASAMEMVELDYAKGKAVLSMFESWLGPEDFRRGVNLYLKRHEWGNASADDLWKALSEASRKDVGAVMAGFLDQPGLPLVTAEPLPGGKVRLSQRRFLNEGVEADPLTWKIPVVLTAGDGKSVRRVAVLLSEPVQTVPVEGLGAIAWIMPNAEARGYYRWAVPAPALAELVKRSADVLGPRERVGLLGNLAALLDAGVIHADAYLEALAGMADDPDPQVIYALVAGLEKVDRALVPDERDARFAAYVRRVLGPALGRFGLERKPGEKEAVSLLRLKLLEWLGGAGQDEAVLRYARELARRYAAGEPVDPSPAGAALKVAARHGDRALFDEYRRRFERSQVPADRYRYLDAFGHFQDGAIQDEVLRYALEGPVRPNEVFLIPTAMSGNAGDASDAGSERLLQWLEDRYPQIAGKLPAAVMPLLPKLAEGCSEEQMRKAVVFFSQPDHSVPGTASQLTRVSEEVTDCARLRRREGEAAAGYLRGLRTSGQPARAAGGSF